MEGTLPGIDGRLARQRASVVTRVGQHSKEYLDHETSRLRASHRSTANSAALFAFTGSDGRLALASALASPA